MPDARDKLRAWTLVDELVLEVYAVTRAPVPGHAVPGPADDLTAALRSAAIRGALRTTHAVQGRPDDLCATVRAALASLGELRYYLYLSRRLGVIDLRRYRSACARHERAQKVLRELLPAGDEVRSGTDPTPAPAVGPGGGALAQTIAPYELDREG